jgi:peptidoglycan biosynthesis protein MviN/MurJ (putative lipid II flippase)
MSVAYFFEALIGFRLLNKVKDVKKIVTWKRTVKPIFKKLLNALIMGIGMYFVFKLFDLELDTTRTIQVAILTVSVTAYGFLSYLIGAKVFKIKEFEYVVTLAKDFWRKFKKSK